MPCAAQIGTRTRMRSPGFVSRSPRWSVNYIAPDDASRLSEPEGRLSVCASLTRRGRTPLALASCAGSRFLETNHEFVQSNECEAWTRAAAARRRGPPRCAARGAPQRRRGRHAACVGSTSRAAARRGRARGCAQVCAGHRSDQRRSTAASSSSSDVTDHSHTPGTSTSPRSSRHTRRRSASRRSPPSCPSTVSVRRS